MAVLTRRPGERVRIGSDVLVTVNLVRGREVRLSIDAPAGLPVVHEETYQAMMRTNRDGLIPETLTVSVLGFFSDSLGKQALIEERFT